MNFDLQNRAAFIIFNNFNNYFEKADQPSEGEVRHWKDGDYKFEEGHWKKVLPTHTEEGIKIWYPEKIKELFLQDKDFLIRSLLKLYEFQTDEEQKIKNTKNINGEGFTGFDGRILSNLCEFYKKNKYFSPKQLAVVRKLMPKYAGQIANIANWFEYNKKKNK